MCHHIKLQNHWLDYGSEKESHFRFIIEVSLSHFEKKVFSLYRHKEIDYVHCRVIGQYGIVNFVDM